MIGVRAADNFVASGRQFLNWWVQELADFLPPRGPRSRAPDATVVVVALDAEEPEIFLESHKGRVAHVGADGGSLVDRLREALMLWPQSVVRIRLSDRQCFKRTTQLPAGAHRDFDRILALELERDTPFPTGTILSGYRLIGRPDRRGLQLVEHFVVKRSLIATALEDIREAGGTIDGVECWDAVRATALPIVIPLEARPAAERVKHNIKGLILLLLALSVLGAWQLLARQEAAIQALAAEATLLTPSVKEVVARAEADRLLEESSSRLRTLKQSRLPASVVLHRVTRALPDHTWLDSFKIDEDSIEISGLSQTATLLLPLLEAAACCSDVRLLGPVRYDPDHDRERFQIKARILPASGKALVAVTPETPGPRQ